MRVIIEVTFLLGLIYNAKSVPLVLKESSPSGEAIVAISSSDPDVNKYINFAYSGDGSTPQPVPNQDNPAFGRSFSYVSPGGAAAGTGRGFVSTSAINPFLLPIFFNPINLEGIGLNNFGNFNDWFRGVEGVYEPSFGGNGGVRTASAVNDNGHIYGNVKTITFDSRAKSSN